MCVVNTLVLSNLCEYRHKYICVFPEIRDSLDHIFLADSIRQFFVSKQLCLFINTKIEQNEAAHTLIRYTDDYLQHALQQNITGSGGGAINDWPTTKTLSDRPICDQNIETQ